MRSEKPKLYWRIKDKQTQKWNWKAAHPVKKTMKWMYTPIPEEEE